MAKITCDCGYVAEHTDHYMTEGMMWEHAMKDHHEMVMKQTVTEIAGWLKGADKEMGVK